ncbi:transcriptional regulator, LuxR family [Bacteroides coprosuis DSM 18011]|uniref:Transcriptional regulator, LuxR family n=1 Tax=Bacteroides coprosuis DSM 18011 TaxID=679937 RepID=F3ZSB6_9BACE|nr:MULTISPECIES: helix-turn-helix transcriptional regulator [Bacteroides]EGJ70853.1 transcriptional regulator, LuxR family [Bacteroides coprosuis DSM 18011]HJD92960.1 LuxR C-terminal-related transcriptional regulator [Bacteroides coprosuis]
MKHPSHTSKNGPKPEIAIVEPNILAALGLKSILQELIPIAIIRVFHSFEHFMSDTPDMYAHYFITGQIYLEHNFFFLPRKRRTIVMSPENQMMLISGVKLLNIHQDEKGIIKSIMDLHRNAHEPNHSKNMEAINAHQVHELSPREIDVISLIAVGKTNKEIAKKLSISQTTVITHRKNITDKLGIKSVSGLTIYAVINGYIDTNQI